MRTSGSLPAVNTSTGRSGAPSHGSYAAPSADPSAIRWLELHAKDSLQNIKIKTQEAVGSSMQQAVYESFNQILHQYTHTITNSALTLDKKFFKAYEIKVKENAHECRLMLRRKIADFLFDQDGNFDDTALGFIKYLLSSEPLGDTDETFHHDRLREKLRRVFGDSLIKQLHGRLLQLPSNKNLVPLFNDIQAPRHPHIQKVTQLSLGKFDWKTWPAPGSVESVRDARMAACVAYLENIYQEPGRSTCWLTANQMQFHYMEAEIFLKENKSILETGLCLFQTKEGVEEVPLCTTLHSEQRYAYPLKLGADLRIAIPSNYFNFLDSWMPQCIFLQDSRVMNAVLDALGFEKDIGTFSERTKLIEKAVAMLPAEEDVDGKNYHHASMSLIIRTMLLNRQGLSELHVRYADKHQKLHFRLEQLRAERQLITDPLREWEPGECEALLTELNEEIQRTTEKCDKVYNLLTKKGTDREDLDILFRVTQVKKEIISANEYFSACFECTLLKAWEHTYPRTIVRCDPQQDWENIAHVLRNSPLCRKLPAAAQEVLKTAQALYFKRVHYEHERRVNDSGGGYSMLVIQDPNDPGYAKRIDTPKDFQRFIAELIAEAGEHCKEPGSGAVSANMANYAMSREYIDDLMRNTKIGPMQLFETVKRETKDYIWHSVGRTATATAIKINRKEGIREFDVYNSVPEVVFNSRNRFLPTSAADLLHTTLLFLRESHKTNQINQLKNEGVDFSMSPALAFLHHFNILHGHSSLLPALSLPDQRSVDIWVENTFVNAAKNIWTQRRTDPSIEMLIENLENNMGEKTEESFKWWEVSYKEKEMIFAEIILEDVKRGDDGSYCLQDVMQAAKTFLSLIYQRPTFLSKHELYRSRMRILFEEMTNAFPPPLAIIADMNHQAFHEPFPQYLAVGYNYRKGRLETCLVTDYGGAYQKISWVNKLNELPYLWTFNLFPEK